MSESRPAWNVSLWINNDEGLYNLARDCIRQTNTRQEAASMLLDWLHQMGSTHTPDGYKYTVTSIKSAMVGM